MKPPHPKPKAIFTVGALGASVRVPNYKIQNKTKNQSKQAKTIVSRDL